MSRFRANQVRNMLDDDDDDDACASSSDSCVDSCDDDEEDLVEFIKMNQVNLMRKIYLTTNY